MDVKNGEIVAGLFVLVFLYSQNVIAGDDEYLSLLEAEAAESIIDSGEESSKNISKETREYKSVVNINLNDWSGECSSVENILPANIRWQDFSSYLAQCSMTTFSLYRRLDSNLKRSIYKHYSSTDLVKVNQLRKKILKIYSRAGT
jgi:hypothetical protein